MQGARERKCFRCVTDIHIGDSSNLHFLNGPRWHFSNLGDWTFEESKAKMTNIDRGSPSGLCAICCRPCVSTRKSFVFFKLHRHGWCDLGRVSIDVLGFQQECHGHVLFQWLVNRKGLNPATDGR